MPHANHADYITAVRQELEADDIRVLDQHVSTTQHRTARLHLDPDQDEIAFTDLDQLLLDWDEHAGWRITPVYQPQVGIGAVPIYRGLDVVPTPEAITAWVGTVLTTPEVIASRGDSLLRQPGDDPAFDTALAVYHRATR